MSNVYVSSDDNTVQPRFTTNTVTVVTNDTQVDVTQRVTNIVQINTVGPQGSRGEQGPQGIPGTSGGDYIASSWSGSNLSQFAGTASFAQTASYINPTFISASAAAAGFGSGDSPSSPESDPIFVAVSGSLVTTSSFNIFTSSIQTQVNSLINATSSYVVSSQTGSFVTNDQTSSFVLNQSTASMLQPYVLTSVTASMLQPYVLTSVTGSMLQPYVLTSVTGSMLQPYVLTSVTGSMLQPYVLTSVTGSMIVSGALTASFLPVNTYQITASWAQSASQAITASYALFALNGGTTTTPGGANTQIQYNFNDSFRGVPRLTYDGTTLRATGSFTGSLTGNLFGTASWAQFVSPVGTTSQIIYNNGTVLTSDSKLAFDGSSFVVRNNDNSVDAFSTAQNKDYTYTEIPQQRYLSRTRQDSLIDNAVQTGEVIQPGTTSGITDWDLAYLDDADSTWKAVDQTSTKSANLLGIYDSNASVIYLEGYLVVGDSVNASGVPLISGSLAAGKPVYIAEGATSAPFLSTIVPTSGIVRIMGHLIRNRNNYYWLMKFRPDHTWVEI